MMNIRSLSGVACAAVAIATAMPAAAQDRGETITPHFEQATPNIPGKSLVAQFVDYAPGGASLPHAHAKSAFIFAYVLSGEIESQVNDEPKRVYRAGEVTADAKVRAQIKKLQDDGYGHYPVCVAKTQYSFSTDPTLRGAPSGHTVNIREVRLSAGAEFVVMVCGDIMTMPGLPKVPAATKIDLTADGKVIGLF